jgi:hypothetical protein
MVYVLHLWLGIYQAGDPAEWLWSYVFLAMLMFLFAVLAAGRSRRDGCGATFRRLGTGTALWENSSTPWANIGKSSACLKGNLTKKASMAELVNVVRDWTRSHYPRDIFALVPLGVTGCSILMLIAIGPWVNGKFGYPGLVPLLIVRVQRRS